MAFPFLSETGFEAGTLGHFDTESDSGTRLDFPHYSTLAGVPGMPAPWRGAYCMRVDLAPNTTAAYVQETGSWDLTNGTDDINIRFMFWFGGTPVMANNDEFAVLQFWSGTNTVQAGVYVNYTTASGYRLGIGATSASQFMPLPLNRWHCVEVFFDPAAGTGTIDGRLNGASFTQVGSLTNADITSGVLGVMGQDAGTTRGIVLFDDVVADDVRVGQPERRFPQTRLITTATEHVFVGNGVIENLALLAGAATDNVLTVFDTDSAYTTDAANIVDELKNTANSQVVDSARVPFSIQRGAYISMTGTNPRALVQIKCAAGYWSDAAIRSLGSRWRTRRPVGSGV